MTMMSIQQIQELRRQVKTNAEDEELNDAVTLPETDDDDDTAYESEEETQIAQAMVRAAFTKSKSTPVLNLLLKAAFQEEERNKRGRNDETPTADAIALSHSMMQQQHRKKPKLEAVVPNHRIATSQVRLSISEPSLKFLKSNNDDAAAAQKIRPSSTKPSDKLKSIMTQAGYTFKTFPYKSLRGFFCKLEDEHIAKYDTDLVRAVRDQNVPVLRERLTDNLHAGNKFGETILHAACRRGALSVVQFFIHEGKHPVRVCCDYGRTVLHDAVWTCAPEFGVIDILLDACPDLLFISDRRGNCALDYVPVDQHAKWCEYLEGRGAHALRPEILQ